MVVSIGGTTQDTAIAEICGRHRLWLHVDAAYAGAASIVPELRHHFAGMERADSIVHRDELLHELWHFPESSHTRAVDHAIVRLRRKIEPDPRHPRFIRTAHGGGYLLTAMGAANED